MGHRQRQLRLVDRLQVIQGTAKKAFDLNANHLNSRAKELNQLADGVNRMKAFMMPDAEEQQATWEELHEKESDNGQHLL